MQAFGNLPEFIPPLVQGITIIRPIPEELLSPAEAATQAAQLFDKVRLMDSAKIGTIFPIYEQRLPNPEVIAVPPAGGNPGVIGVPAEQVPLPISFSNMLLPAGAYQLLSANSITVTLALVLNLYNTPNHLPRCSYLPVGIDILPAQLTLPSTYASELLAISAEGIRWLELNASYDTLFAAIYNTNTPYYVIPSILSVPIPGATIGSVPYTATGLVTAANSNPSFPPGSQIWSASSERQTSVFANARAMYALNNCDKNHVRKQCGFVDPCSEAAIVNLKLKIPF